MTTSDVIVSVRRAWSATTVVVAATIAVLGVVFWQEALDAFRVWRESTAYNHCFLVLPLAGYLIWERRTFLGSVTPKPQFAALAIMPFLSIAWLLATVLSIHEAQQFIVLTILEVILLSVLGWDVFKCLMGPLLYLYFLVPSGAFLVPALQDLTASMVVKGLHLAGVPVFADGIFIEIPAGKFVIAEACAGLRFLVASVAFGVFFALLSYRSWTRRIGFIVLSAAIPILANGLRAFGIVYAAYVLDNAAAVEADHVIYGWGFYSAILLLLIVIGRTFADRNAAPFESAVSVPRASSGMPTRTALAGLLGAVLASLGPAYAAVLDRGPATAVITHARPPNVAATWTPAADDKFGWTPVVHGADRTFLDAFSDGNINIYRFVALYIARGGVNNLIRGDNRIVNEPNWMMATPSTAQVTISGHSDRVIATEIESGSRRRLVISYYAVGGANASDPLTVKMQQILGLFSPEPQVSAFVAVAVDMPDRTAPPLTAVTRFLDAMEPLPDYLRRLSK